MKKHRTLHKGSFIKRHLERVRGCDYKKALGTDQCGSGVYVLYNKKGGVYYIGMSGKSMRRRIGAHWTRDKHKGKWSRFSFYQIKRKRFIIDIESLLLKVNRKPKGNSKAGKFPSHYNLANRK